MGLKQALKAIGPLHRTVARLKRSRIHEGDRYPGTIEFLGSDYGGWGLDPALLGPDAVIYSIGVGEDISFDLALIERTGCTVHAFDPTPIAVDWIARQSLPGELCFHPLGASDEDAVATFHVPPIDGYHSFSLQAQPDAEVSGTITAPVRRVATIMAELGHRRLDLLKMDIEGFEYRVLDDLAVTGIRPRQLLVEFHHGMYTHTNAESRRAVRKLRDSGYRLAWLSNVGREYCFIDTQS